MLPALIVSTISSACTLVPVELACEAMVDPCGIGTATPRLSWTLRPAREGLTNLRQTAYRIVVGSRPGEADLWDSGLVKSNKTFGIPYAGRKLTSSQECFWRVQVTDQSGEASAWSVEASWVVGLLQTSEWKGEWIGFDAPAKRSERSDPFAEAHWIWGAPSEASARATRTFKLATAASRATLLITADDQWQLTINGRSVAASDGKTDAWRRPVTLDVKNFLNPGENQIKIDAQNGQGQSGIIAVLNLEIEGKSQRIVTDSAWDIHGESARSLGVHGVAPWGRLGPTSLHLPPPRYLRKEFSLKGPVKRAVAHVSALGLVELYLNGSRVGEDLFVPGWTDYTKRVYARSYDVTELLTMGSNAAGIILGDGWYSGYVGYGLLRDHYGTKTRARLHLVVTYADATEDVIVTDPSWRSGTGPILESDFLMGETYDAQREMEGWSQAGFSASWEPVDTGAEVNPIIEPYPAEPVRQIQELRAKTITEPKPGVYVLDLGQNIAGWAALRTRGTKGQRITLRFAERLSPDGNIYTENLRAARTIDTYICRGDGREEWQPRFTFHGFQYIEVSGLSHRPGPEEVVGIAIASATPRAGEIETSDPMLNRLVENARWTQWMNFIDIPTDCPQRDERLGWTGDAQAYVRTSAYLADVQPFFTKWLISLDDAQRADSQYPMVAPLKVAGDDGGPAWADAGVICPWEIYLAYGDRDLLARHYPNMKRFVDFCVKRSKSDLMPPDSFHCFGDWLSIRAETPHPVIYLAYLAGSARIVAQAADALGETSDARAYRAIFDRARATFQTRMVTPDGRVSGNTQCGYVLALAFDLLNPAQTSLAAQHLVSDIESRGGHLSTGFVGTRDIMHVLSKIGRQDVALRLLHNTTFPSWGFTIKNGATSIWERWDGWTPEKGFQDPGMNSFAHYAFGAVVGWMFERMGGIRPAEPGYRRISIAPQFDPKLKHLECVYNSVAGPISVRWKQASGGHEVELTVPPNTEADVTLPESILACEPPPPTPLARGQQSMTLGSGRYRIVCGRG